MKEHKKYTESELIIGIFFFLLIDGICAVLSFLGIGLILSPLRGFGTFVQIMWARTKGDKNATKFGRQITKYAVNALPVIPTLTTAFLIEALIHNKLKASQLTGKTAGTAMGGFASGAVAK